MLMVQIRKCCLLFSFSLETNLTFFVICFFSFSSCWRKAYAIFFWIKEKVFQISILIEMDECVKHLDYSWKRMLTCFFIYLIEFYFSVAIFQNFSDKSNFLITFFVFQTKKSPKCLIQLFSWSWRFSAMLSDSN